MTTLRSLILLVASGAAACSPCALPLPPTHPARADATPAPVAEPSKTLAPGVAGDVLADPPASQPGTGSGGHSHYGGSR